MSGENSSQKHVTFCLGFSRQSRLAHNSFPLWIWMEKWISRSPVKQSPSLVLWLVCRNPSCPHEELKDYVSVVFIEAIRVDWFRHLTLFLQQLIGLHVHVFVFCRSLSKMGSNADWFTTHSSFITDFNGKVNQLDTGKTIHFFSTVISMP